MNAMLEADFYGKLLPTHPDIMAILRDIRSEYDIPEISPTLPPSVLHSELLRDPHFLRLGCTRL